MNMPSIQLDREKIVELSHDIPAFPKIALQLLTLMGDDEGNLHLLENHAKHDPVISFRLLGLANSAWGNASGHNIEDIYSAISMLGMSRVRQLVLSLSIQGAFQKFLSRAKSAELWEHCIDAGICAQVLAEHFGQNGEFAYICGLVHDVGRLWLAYNFPDAYETVGKRLREGGSISEIDAERQTFGMDHAQIGEILSEIWGLPPLIRQTIFWHHGSPTMSDDPMVVLIHLTEVICQALYGNDYPIAYLSPLIESVIHPNWEDMPYIYGEIEARTRLARAEIQGLVG